MKRLLVCLLILGVALVGTVALVQAAENANAKIQLHLMNSSTKNKCTRARLTCNNMAVTTANLYPLYTWAYLVVSDGNATVGIAGLQMGLDYDPAKLFMEGWYLCGKLEFSYAGWPGDEGDNLITFDASSVDPQTGCQKYEPGGAGTGVVAVAGYFNVTAYSPVQMFLTPRGTDHLAKVASCAAVEDIVAGEPPATGYPVFNPSHLGYVGFGMPGYNPCGIVVPVQNTTWGAVKNVYR